MDTKLIVEELIKKHNTTNPFIIADNLGITILYRSMNSTLGFYNHYKRFKFIHLNENTAERLQFFVCAHELGHAVQHPRVNTPFLKTYTLFSPDRIEREANKFAVELLLPDSLIQEYEDYSIYTIAKSVGIPEKMVDYKQFEHY